jgi:hypothetical protein
MRKTAHILVGVLMIGMSIIGAGLAQAQSGPGGQINVQRDCQTVVQCRFRRGGVYRGCISAFSCRRCRFVRDRCTIQGQRGTCRRLRCTWG